MAQNMSSRSDTSEQAAASSLHENAQNLLLALSDAKDYRASTSDLKKPTGLSSSNISGRHAKTLIHEGWAQKVGSEDVNAPNAANVYELTPQGKKQANLLSKRKPTPMSEEQRTLMMQNLQEQVRELEERIEHQGGREASVDDDLLEQVEANSESIENHEDRLDDIGDALDSIEGTLKKVIRRVK